jgi:hypothetical protein
MVYGKEVPICQSAWTACQSCKRKTRYERRNSYSTSLDFQQNSLGQRMYGLSKEADLTFFLRQELSKVLTNEYQAQLYFGTNFCLSIEGEIEINGKKSEFEQLRNLVGKVVFGITIQNEGGINILFHDGSYLSVLDSNEYYESYQITAPEINIVV